MTLVPADGHITDASRTVDEVKADLNAMIDVLNEIGGGANDGVELIATISSGAIATPVAQMIKIQGESSAADDLTGIGVTSLANGRIIFLRNYDEDTTWSDVSGSGTGAYVTVKHTASPTAGQIFLAGAEDFVLAGRRCLALRLMDNGSGVYHWSEIGRFFGGDHADEREFMDLGSSAVLDVEDSAVADANGKVLKVGATLATDSVLKVNSSGAIVPATGAELGGGDADTVDSLHAASFVRNDNAVAQEVQGAFQSEADSTIDNAGWAGNAALVSDVSFKLGGTRRGYIRSTATDGSAGNEKLYLYTENGGTARGGIEIGDEVKAKTQSGSFDRVVGVTELASIDAIKLGGRLPAEFMGTSKIIQLREDRTITNDVGSGGGFADLTCPDVVNASVRYWWLDAFQGITFPGGGADGTNMFEVIVHFSYVMGHLEHIYGTSAGVAGGAACVFTGPNGDTTDMTASGSLVMTQPDGLNSDGRGSYSGFLVPIYGSGSGVAYGAKPEGNRFLTTAIIKPDSGHKLSIATNGVNYANINDVWYGSTGGHVYGSVETSAGFGAPAVPLGAGAGGCWVIINQITPPTITDVTF